MKNLGLLDEIDPCQTSNWQLINCEYALVVVRTWDRRVTVRVSYRIDRFTARDSELLESGVFYPRLPSKKISRTDTQISFHKPKKGIISAHQCIKKKTIHAFIKFSSYAWGRTPSTSRR